MATSRAAKGCEAGGGAGGEGVNACGGEEGKGGEVGEGGVSGGEEGVGTGGAGGGEGAITQTHSNTPPHSTALVARL